DPKTLDEKGLRAYMADILPEYDEERVHVSDLRKLFSWFNMLHGAGLLTAEEKQDDGDKKIVADDKTKQPALKKDTVSKQQAKSNAPKVKAQGVRKTGTA
ncbi:MAG: hypothetical protein RL007_2521, partial [Bacteroidota bacterium]